MSNRDFLNKYHDAEPYSFGGISQVKNYFDVKSKKVAKVLSKSDVYTTFREFKKPSKTPPIRTYGPNYLWEADLMFFTHPDFASSNEGFFYILAFIDTFTKAAGIMKLKTKDTKIVTEMMKKKFDNGDKPKYLRVDAGGEFLSHTFTQMCAKHNVKVYIAQEPIKCAFIERFNRTFKRILVQLMEHHNSVRWVDFIKPAISIYQSRKHSSIGMSPDEAEDEENHEAIYDKLLRKYAKDDRIKYIKNKKLPKFRKGDIVKIFKKKGIFTRGFNQSVTKEYFTIYHIDRRLSKDRYYLKDLTGERIIGSFYSEYLVPFTPPTNGGEYRIDPNFSDFKRKRIRGVPHIWVKWLGWPSKFNQWIPEADIRHLLPQNHEQRN
jgi:hypothetical protein